MTLEEAVAATGGDVVSGHLIHYHRGKHVDVGEVGSDGKFRLNDAGEAHLASLNEDPLASPEAEADADRQLELVADESETPAEPEVEDAPAEETPAADTEDLDTLLG